MMSRSLRWTVGGALVGLAIQTGVLAQTPAQAPPQTPPKPPPAAAPAPPPAEAYSYDAAGRRDPFVSLLSRGGDFRPEERPAGVGGLLIGDITIRGIVKSGDSFIGLIQGPDSRTYIVRAGQRLLDGTIRAITIDTMVFSQEVNDPLSLVKQREVRKTIRAMQEGK